MHKGPYVLDLFASIRMVTGGLVDPCSPPKIQARGVIENVLNGDWSMTCLQGNRPISVYRLGEIPIQSCRQSVSALRGKAGARLNAHTELRAMRQRSALEAIY
jgi:hypothetical protein